MERVKAKTLSTNFLPLPVYTWNEREVDGASPYTEKKKKKRGGEEGRNSRRKIVHSLPLPLEIHYRNPIYE